MYQMKLCHYLINRWLPDGKCLPPPINTYNSRVIAAFRVLYQSVGLRFFKFTHSVKNNKKKTAYDWFSAWSRPLW